jgi:hypothetical protein
MLFACWSTDAYAKEKQKLFATSKELGYIERPALNPSDTHISETVLDDYSSLDLRLTNIEEDAGAMLTPLLERLL